MRSTDDALIALLQRNGLWVADGVVTPLAGINSRISIVEAGGRRLVAKHYFRDSPSARDRLGAEWAFLDYAAGLVPRCVPGTIVADRDASIAVYEYLDGHKLNAGDVRPNHIAAAVDFFLGLNGANRNAEAAGLPMGAEACFSIGDHLALVDGRIARLAAIPNDGSPLAAEVVEFIAALGKVWHEKKAQLDREVARLGWGVAESLPAEQRCVSPSDFGFHNAIVRPSGAVAFIDFEYAGWDDPAKMAADFFCQPAVPVPLEAFGDFVDKAMRFAAYPAALRQRAILFLPVLRVKWCCIMLNEFLPDAVRRRQYADPDRDDDSRKRLQLDKAQRALAALNTL
jgi:hypothetical protein